MEVRVTPHSSSLSWDGIGARQTKAKADGGWGGWGGRWKRELGRRWEWEKERERGEKLTKKSERSCQLPTDEDRGGDSEKGGITWRGGKKGRGMKKEQKKSAKCFYCIDLKLAAERRKRKEGGRAMCLPRWENKKSAVEVWLLSRPFSWCVCVCVRACVCPHVYVCVYTYRWWGRLISFSEEYVSVSQRVESQFRERTMGLEWHVTDSTIHTAD